MITTAQLMLTLSPTGRHYLVFGPIDGSIYSEFTVGEPEGEIPDNQHQLIFLRQVLPLVIRLVE